jgi:hypothetical protein
LAFVAREAAVDEPAPVELVHAWHAHQDKRAIEL